MLPTIYFANDHAGYEIKQAILDHLKAKGYQVVDLGANEQDGRVDYPAYGFAVSEQVSLEKDAIGLLVCGTGIGMSMAASQVSSNRVALVYDEQSAKLAKEHNNANVISLGARTHDLPKILKMIDAYLDAEFANDRHGVRLQQIQEYKNQK